MAVDTTLPSLRISSRYIFYYSDTAGMDQHQPGLLIEFDSSSASDVVNVYADSNIVSREIDSVIQIYCKGKDLRLIGKNNGQELAVPFHTLHRFPEITDTLYFAESDAHLLFVDEENVTANDLPSHFSQNGENYFRLFYGDAFNPLDSSIRFPMRKLNLQTIDMLMLEGQSWEGVNFKAVVDSAQKLAAYNEFVNKLEIFDKVGSFCTMRKAFMSADGDQYVKWGRLLNVFSVHYSVVHDLREGATMYLSNKIANDGGTPKQFTDEDLRLLYPDRLVWCNRISGAHEHRYDPYMIGEWFWKDEIPQIKLPPVKPGHGGNWENQLNEPNKADAE